MKKFFHLIVGSFLFGALYTPVFWYISVVKTRHGGSWAPNLFEATVSTFLMAMPVVVIVVLALESRK